MGSHGQTTRQKPVEALDGELHHLLPSAWRNPLSFGLSYDLKLLKILRFALVQLEFFKTKVSTSFASSIRSSFMRMLARFKYTLPSLERVA